MNQDFQIRHESKHYRPCNQYKHRFHRSHHRSLLGGRSVKPNFTFLGKEKTRIPDIYVLDLKKVDLCSVEIHEHGQPEMVNSLESKSVLRCQIIA